MLDIGWSELLVIGVIALLVVGPKELPGLLRTLGKYIGMIRRQANEFRQHFDDVLKETELEDLKKDVQDIRDQATASMRDVESAARVDDSAIGSTTKANFDQKNLDWYDPDPKPLPAEIAAKVAREGAAATAAAAVAEAKAADSGGAADTATAAASEDPTSTTGGGDAELARRAAAAADA
ncbi:MAG: Sec-independent protein translocase protein TatB [Pseudomonadota bacterium]